MSSWVFSLEYILHCYIISKGIKFTCKDLILRKVLFSLGVFCFVLQAAVPTCFSQPEFTLVRATPAGWWRAPWSSWWAVIPLLSSSGNASSSRLCPCLILMESSMASELWHVLFLGFVSVPCRLIFNVCAGELPFARVLLILLSVLCESETWPGVLSCICQVHVVL